MTESRKKEKIITFYSFKGGVGRTMALANVACLLAERQNETGGKGVLLIDWDLDAPGLHRFFPKTEITVNSPGVIDLFEEIQKNLNDYSNETPASEKELSTIIENLNLDLYIQKDLKITPSKLPVIDILTHGKEDEDYPSRVSGFQWNEFFDKAPSFFRLFAKKLKQQYQYILIDSRTGFTDISGICTTLMPEVLVLVFSPNHQNITGVINLFKEATDYRKLSDDLRPLVAFPLPSRIDSNELERKEVWRAGNFNTEKDEEITIEGYQPEFEKAFKEIYKLPVCNLTSYFNKVQIPYFPYYAYGEEIAVLRERELRGAIDYISRNYVEFEKRLIELPGPWRDAEKYKSDSLVDLYGEEAEIELLNRFLSLAQHEKINALGDIGINVDIKKEEKDSEDFIGFYQEAKKQTQLARLWDIVNKLTSSHTVIS